MDFNKFTSGVIAANRNLPSKPGETERSSQYLTGNFLHSLKSSVVKNESISLGLVKIKAKESSSLKCKFGHFFLSLFYIRTCLAY